MKRKLIKKVFKFFGPLVALVIFLFVMIFFYRGCDQAVNNDVTERNSDAISVYKPSNSAKNVSSAIMSKQRLMGDWTDGTTAIATYRIGPDSIFDVEQEKSFAYSINGAQIKIKHPGYTFIGEISFHKDTLVIKSADGTSKFWRLHK